ALHVARLTVEGLNDTATITAIITTTTVIAITIVITITCYKIGAAATIYPDPATVPAPCPPLNTRRVTTLTHQTDAAARISGAIIALSIVRSAVYLLKIAAGCGGQTSVRFGQNVETGAANKNNRQ